MSAIDLEIRAGALRGVARALRYIATPGLTPTERRELEELWSQYDAAATTAEAEHEAAVEALRAAEVAA